MLRGNKGEWSEIYTLLKLLGDKEIHVGNKDLQKIPNLFYPIVKILRNDGGNEFEYSINDELVIVNDKGSPFSISINTFKKQSLQLLRHIQNNKSRSFEIPDMEHFLSQIKCKSLKASASSKADIHIIVHDIKTHFQQNLGFSIKSQLGSPSTLINAGKTTNFIYKIRNCTLNQDEISAINEINNKTKIQSRLQKLIENGCQLDFVQTENKIFENNLIMIDSSLPRIISELVLLFYSQPLSSIVDLIKRVEYLNPIGYDISHHHRFYEYKIKHFLTEFALGMVPSKVWSGKYDATGGYLVVKDNGDILSYHIINKNNFEEYLFNNTKLETASSTRHDFGKIYMSNGEYYIKLNLQVRFKK